MSGFNLTLDNTEMQVIKIDGGNDIVPSDSVQSVGILYPGERMDVVTSLEYAKGVSITLDPEYVLSHRLTLSTDGPPGTSNL
jgi:hypothetical protein